MDNSTEKYTDIMQMHSLLPFIADNCTKNIKYFVKKYCTTNYFLLYHELLLFL